VAYVLEGGYDLDALTSSIADIARVHDLGGSAERADRNAIPTNVQRTLWAAIQGSEQRAAKERD
jgi:hypothetical protein